MAIAATGYKSNDGKWFDDELSATRHEVIQDIRKRFPSIADRMVEIEKHAVELSNALLPLALVSQKPPLTSQETTLEPETTLTPESTSEPIYDLNAPADNLPDGWAYLHTFQSGERIIDAYRSDDAVVEWPRLNTRWPVSMHRDEPIRFGATALLGCAHRWTDTETTLVDECLECGEQRA